MFNVVVPPQIHPTLKFKTPKSPHIQHDWTCSALKIKILLVPDN